MRIITIGLLLLLTACGGKEETTNTPASTPQPAPTVATTPPSHGQNHGSQQTISESMSIAGVIIDINMKGTLRPHSEYQGVITLVSGKQGTTIRLWIGDESGAGSMKYKANEHGDHYHAIAVVPKEIHAKTALWIEVQSVFGERELGKIALQ